MHLIEQLAKNKLFSLSFQGLPKASLKAYKGSVRAYRDIHGSISFVGLRVQSRKPVGNTFRAGFAAEAILKGTALQISCSRLI